MPQGIKPTYILFVLSEVKATYKEEYEYKYYWNYPEVKARYRINERMSVNVLYKKLTKSLQYEHKGHVKEN